jgi:hypothetical protein
VFTRGAAAADLALRGPFFELALGAPDRVLPVHGDAHDAPAT